MTNKKRTHGGEVEKTIISPESYRGILNQNGQSSNFQHATTFSAKGETHLYVCCPEKNPYAEIQQFVLRMVGTPSALEEYVQFYLPRKPEDRNWDIYTGAGLGELVKEFTYFPGSKKQVVTMDLNSTNKKLIEGTFEEFSERMDSGEITPNEAITRYILLRGEAIREAKQILEGEAKTGTRVEKILRYGELSRRTKEGLVIKNKGLIYMTFQKMRIWDEAKKEELFSEGLATLDRAIKKFNPNKGMQFSTYASKALRMSFYGTMGREYRRNRKFPASYDPEKERPKKTLHSFSIGEEEIEEVRKILDRNSANLDEREIEIIRKRYLSGGEIQTLEEVGKKIGVTKERTRQIQKNALEKLRKALRGSFDISRKE